MKGRLLNLATALLLVLFLAAAGAWVRSHFVHERLRALPLVARGTAYESSYYEAGQTRGVFWLRAGRTVQPHEDGDEEDAFRRDHAVEMRRRSMSEGRWVRRPASDYIPGDRRDFLERNGFKVLFDGAEYSRYCWCGASVNCPHWAAACVAGALPAARAARAIRAMRRKSSGLCRRCGYDLRATPGRCPECGAEAGPGAGAGTGDRSKEAVSHR